MSWWRPGTRWYSIRLASEFVVCRAMQLCVQKGTSKNWSKRWFTFTEQLHACSQSWLWPGRHGVNVRQRLHLPFQRLTKTAISVATCHPKNNMTQMCQSNSQRNKPASKSSSNLILWTKNQRCYNDNPTTHSFWLMECWNFVQLLDVCSPLRMFRPRAVKGSVTKKLEPLKVGQRW